MAELESRDEHWASVISEWRASGLSQVEFCRRRGITDRALNNWLYKSPYRERAARVLAARARGNGHEETPRFVPVSVGAATDVAEERTVSAAIEVVLARKQGRPHGRPRSASLKSAEVLRLKAEMVSHSEIAHRLGIGRTSVRRILADGGIGTPSEPR